MEIPQKDNKKPEKPIRLADIAQAAGVSKGTASNVFNRPHIVRDEVRQHVLGIAKEMGYRGPDPKGRMLSAGKVNAIGIVTNEELSYFFTDPFSRELMAAIAKVCDQQGLGISLVSAANQKSMAWNMRNAVVDGFILFCHEGNSEPIELSRERSLPVVALTSNDDYHDITIVDIDNVFAAQQAAEYLAKLGHQQFAILTLELRDDEAYGLLTSSRIQQAIYQTGVKRLNGYLAGLEAYGIASEDIPAYETLSDQVSIDHALTQLFDSPTPPTALLAQSDKIALLALEWLAQHNISVPEQVSIIGFDNISESSTCQPSLTTIAQPIQDISQLAVSLLSQPPQQPNYKQLPTELIIRGSCAPPIRP